jgi:hypothetical protein
MTKTSNAYNLNAYPNPVELGYYPKNKTWYPINHYFEPNDGTVFIRGEGRLKIGKWKKVTLDPLPNPYTAEQIKEVADEYGLFAAMGMIQGWGRCNLFADNSCGLDYVKYEVANMATLGKVYDEFTDVVQEVGDNFIQGLLKHKFKLNGTIEKGWLWYDYKNENDCGQLVGMVGIYERIKLHPLQYVDHYLGPSIFACRILPMFNPMDFDLMLAKLFYYRHYSKNGKRSEKMLDKIVSVHDRIQHLTGSKRIADSFEKIFEANKKVEIPNAA